MKGKQIVKEAGQAILGVCVRTRDVKGKQIIKEAGQAILNQLGSGEQFLRRLLTSLGDKGTNGEHKSKVVTISNKSARDGSS